MIDRVSISYEIDYMVTWLNVLIIYASAMSMDKDDKERKPQGIEDLFKMKIFGIDFGQVMKNWLGVTDLGKLQDPAQVEDFKKRLEDQREKLKEFQENFQKKYGDAIRFDYDIKIGSLLGGKDEFRIGGGKFFERLDALAKERNEWKRRIKPSRVTIPYKRQGGVKEPPLEVIEDKDHLEVIVEVPGVDEKDIELDITEDRIKLSTEKSQRKYHAEVELPVKIASEPVERVYNNGILKIRLKKLDQPS